MSRLYIDLVDLYFIHEIDHFFGNLALLDTAFVEMFDNGHFSYFRNRLILLPIQGF